MKTGNFLQLILLEFVDDDYIWKGMANLICAIPLLTYLILRIVLIEIFLDLTWNELLNIQIQHYLK